MRIAQKDDSKVIVSVKTAKRNKEGKMEYETFDSIDVLEAKPEDVVEVVLTALRTASKK